MAYYLPSKFCLRKKGILYFPQNFCSLEHHRCSEDLKSTAMCDSFLGEGTVGVTSGVQVPLQMTYRRNPSLPSRTFQPHPSRWEGIEKFSEYLWCLHN